MFQTQIRILLLLWAGYGATAQSVRHISPECCLGVYQVRYAVHTVTDLSGITNNRGGTPKQITDVQMQCVVTFIPGNRTEAIVELDSIRLSYVVNDVPQTFLAQRVTEELRHSATVVYDSLGAVQGIKVHRDVSAEASSLLSSAVTQLQFTKEQSNEVHESVEHDRTGIYNVHSTVAFSAAPQHRVVKTKNGYQQHVATQFRYSASPVQHSALRGYQESLFWELTPQLVSCSGRDTQTVTLGDAIVAQSVITYSFSNRNEEKSIHPKTTLVADSTVLLSIPEQFSRSDIQRAGMQSVWGGSAVKGILDSLDVLTQKDSALMEVVPRKLSAATGLFPEVGDSLLKRVQTYAQDDFRQRIIADCLSRDGSVANQQRFLQLIALYQTNNAVLPFLVSCFGNIQQPTLQTQQALTMLAFAHEDSFVRSTAQLATGALAYNISAYNIPEADSLLREVLLHANQLRPKQIINIAGNSGLVSALGIIKTILDTSQAELHYRALFSLRFIQHADVDSILAAHLARHDTIIQSTVIRTLTFRQPTAEVLQQLVRVVTDSTITATVRKETTALLRKWNGQFTMFRAQLNTILQQQSVPDAARKQIEKLLE